MKKSLIVILLSAGLSTVVSASNKAGHGKSAPYTGVEEQSNNDHDVAVTTNIRQALVNDKTLSVKAHNIKVITKDGSVILQGPVETASEKTKVEAIAKKYAGSFQIDNRITTN